MNRLTEAGICVLAAGAGVGAYALTNHLMVEAPEQRAKNHNAAVEYCVDLSDEELIASDRCISLVGDVTIRLSQMDDEGDHLGVGTDVIRGKLIDSIEVPEDNSYTPPIAGVFVAGAVSAPVWVKRVNWYGIPKQKKKSGQEPEPVDRGGSDKV